MAREKKRLVLVGNGMAGINTIEHILKLAGNMYDITVIGAEPYPNYNRIQLSYVLEGSKTVDEIVLNPLDWYEENQIRLMTGTKVMRVDTEAKRVYTDLHEEIEYDTLILATGSKPIMLPLPGSELAGIIGFRDIHDCETMLEAAKQFKKAAVIGGGLLGLEAAKGLVKLGMDVTVVHLMNDLMERQLDRAASSMLKDELEAQGLKFAMNAETKAFIGENGRVKGLQLADGSVLDADFVVMAIGIRPNIELARTSGIETRRGITVDDFMRTSAPDVYAIGECNEHRGVCYGLVAPLFEQGMVAAKHICGTETRPYVGSVLSTKLKISGVDVFSAGEFIDAPGLRSVKVQDDWKKVYKKVLLRNNVIVGCVLFGDITDSSRLQLMIKNGTEMTTEIHASIVGGSGCCGGGGAGAFSVKAMADEEIVCGCSGVTKGTIVTGIKTQGWSTVDHVKAATGATRSCGGCKPLVQQILAATLGSKFDAAAQKEGICGCTSMNRDEIVAAIQEKGLKHVNEVMHVLGWKEAEGCSKCRPAINYYLGMLWPAEYEDEKESRFVNERLHANIQKDGTFAVVPRMYGGVTTPDDLRKIADVADKYQIPMVKVTGGQRIDLLGVKKDDLPKVWEELDMPSGYAYSKSLRTVKTCVGSLFCRFGTQDSVHMGIQLEKKFERLSMPAKFKMAVNGCPRNCAEPGVKDIGIIGNDGGWEMYVGGNGGIKPRIADLLCKVKTDEDLIEICGAFIQYYRENGKYGERTSDFIERIGIEPVKKACVEDMEGRRALNARIELALQQTQEPWSQVLADGTLRTQLYDTAEEQVIGSVEDFPLKLGRRVKLGEKEIAVFRVEDEQLYAVENTSPNPKGGPLAEAIVSGHYIFCPIRDWKIDLVDGQVQAPDRGQVQTYPVRVENRQVILGGMQHV